MGSSLALIVPDSRQNPGLQPRTSPLKPTNPER